ncbi:MAG: hypothetical protein H2042_13835 [Rhizobiales bacterium]|nr:hypothetical protein [Hyphomicrobiales bacterium]
MADTIPSLGGPGLARIEPEDRLVVLARTLQAPDSDAADALAANVGRWERFGETCLGQALYAHRAVFRGASDVPAWSHLELSYFRDMVPAEVIRELVLSPSATGLLRAELLLTTPSSFVLPQDWSGAAARPDRQASLEYIDVDAPYLADYRDIMRTYIGPAAAKLVQAGRIGTFRTMETAAVLHHDPSFAISWNQIHLCEVPADGFNGFGQEFDAALREVAPDGGFTAVFSGLDSMRTIPRWTFNACVVEEDAALARVGAGA